MQGPLRVAQLVDAHPPGVEGVLDARRGLGAVGDGDHHRRGLEPHGGPSPGGLAPVVSEQVVAVEHQIGKRLPGPGPAVQVVLDLRVAVDVVEAGFPGAGIGQGVVPDDHPRRLDEAGLDGVVQAEVAHDPAEQRLLRAPPAGRGEGGRGEVVAAEDAARPIDPVEAAHPLGRLLDHGLVDARDAGAAPDPGAARDAGAGAGRLLDAPSVMRLVVDDQEAARLRHVAEHVAHVGFVAPRAALVHAPPAGDPFLPLPVERVPVADDHPALPEPVEHRGRHDAERLVVALRVRGFEHRQAAPDGEAGRDDQHVPGEAAVPRMGDLVQDVPGEDHRHDHGLAGPRRHLGAHPLEAAPVGGNLDADPLRGGRLAQPDQGFDRFELAEEEAPGLELLRVVPVPEQAPGDGGGAGPAGFAPRLDPRADGVDQGDLDEGAGVVEGAGVLGGDDVSGGAAARREVEPAGRAVVTPVVRRLLVGRVDDEPVDGGARHHSGSGGTSASSGARTVGVVSLPGDRAWPRTWPRRMGRLRRLGDGGPADVVPAPLGSIPREGSTTPNRPRGRSAHP